MTADPRRRYAITAVALPLAVVVVYFATRPFLPDYIQDTWSLPTSNDPKRPARVAAFATVMTGVASVVWLVGISRLRVGKPIPGWTQAASLGASMYAVWGCSALLTAVGATDYSEARARWWIACLIFLGFGSAFAVRRGWLGVYPIDHAKLPIPDSTVAVRPHEQVIWTGHARSSVAAPGAVIITVASFAGAIVWTSYTLFGLVAVAVLLRQLVVTTVIDTRGVSLTLTGSRRSRLLVPLAQIKSVSVIEATPLLTIIRASWADGAVPPVRQSFVIRRGPALQIEHAEQGCLTLAVDRADEGADVLNSLLARLRLEAKAAREGVADPLGRA